MGDMVRFQFRENVAAFCAGNYGIERDKNVPCLIDATFNNRLFVYYDIQMRQIGTTNMMRCLEGDEEVQALMSVLNCDASNSAQVRQFYNWCLYGFHPNHKPPS